MSQKLDFIYISIPITNIFSIFAYDKSAFVKILVSFS